MRLLRSLCMALSMYMYSGIPVPQVKWEKENMAYAMCFFPVVGLIQGASKSVEKSLPQVTKQLDA